MWLPGHIPLGGHFPPKLNGDSDPRDFKALFFLAIDPSCPVKPKDDNE